MLMLHRRIFVGTLLMTLLALAAALTVSADPPAPGTKSLQPPASTALPEPPSVGMAGPLDSVELGAARDSWIGSGPGYRDQNRGGDQTLYVGFDTGGAEAERSLLLFNLDPLPEGAVIDTARLSLHQHVATGGSEMDVVVRRIVGGWSEAGVTWNNPPQYDNDRNWASTRVGASSGRYEWNLDALVRRWASGAYVNHGMILIGDETPRVSPFERAFRSRETSNAGERPRLRIEYGMARMNTLPNFVGVGEVQVSWGVAGLSATPPAWDVQYRQRAPEGAYGDWTDWRANVAGTVSPFEGAHNTSYQFRVRAHYLSGGVSSWGPASNETLVDVVPPAVAMNPLPTYSPASFTVGWTGTDNGSGIRDYNFEVYDNNSFVGIFTTTATSQAFTMGLDGHEYAFRVRASDQAGNLSLWSPRVATRVDTQPPTVNIQTLDRYQLTTPIPVQWSGRDAGIGVASFDVQVRENDGPWTDWRPQTVSTDGVYSGVAGRTYRFRVRARDALGNVSAYTSDDMAVVRIVRSMVSGRVVGNRGLPVGGAVVTSDPAAVNSPAITGGAGDFALYLDDTATRRVSVSHPGYQSPPPLTVLGGTGLVEAGTVYLRPSNDTVANGGFEGGLTGWTTTGDVQTALGHTGTGGVRLAAGASLTQRASVPASPTPSRLAFLYRGETGVSSVLQVRLENISTGQTPETFVVTVTGSSWQQLSFDLGALAGALVDVRLSLISGGPLGLDEVSLGEAQPNVYLTWFPHIDRGAALGRRTATPLVKPAPALPVTPFDPHAPLPIDLSRGRE